MPLPADRLPTDLKSLATKVADHDRQIRELRAATTLQHASIDSGALAIKDPDGTVRATLGHQDDGTVAYTAVTGPTPPTPTDPSVTAQLAALGVTWDGTFADGASLPADWLRVEVHVDADPAFIPSQSTLRATIETPAGGTVSIALGYSTWYVCLRSISTSGAASEPSAAIAGTPRQADGGDLTVDALNGKIINGGTFNGTNWTQNENGTFFYSGTPAAGNLVAAIAPTYGTDAFGNDYLAGVTSYDATGTYINLDSGFVTIGSPSNTSPAVLQATHAENVYLFSGRTDADTVAASLELVAGVETSGTGSAGAAKVYVSNTVGLNTATDLVMPSKGSIYPLGAAWQAPTMGTGWVTGPGGSGSYPPLKWRLDAEDNVHLFGVFHPSTASPDGVIASGLPVVNLTHLGGVAVVGAIPRFQGGAGTITAYLNDTGQLRMNLSPTLAAGDSFMVNALIPLGNLT